jgi:hypothetical protein
VKKGHVTVFGSMFHTHQAGREAYSKLMRDEKEVAYLYKNQWYDPDYQYYSFLPKRIDVLKV